MTPLRVYSFLGEAAAPHYAAVGGLVARAAGLEPAPFGEPGLARLDEIVAAPGPALLFLCGLPYVRLSDENAPVEAIAAAVPIGEPGPQYFAELVVREGLDAASAADLGGRRVGFNGRDSLSGYVLPYAALEPRGLAEPLYADAIETGSHRRSLALLAAGEIDAAAIDSTVLALEARDDPAIAALRVLERLGPAPDPAGGAAERRPGARRRLRAALVGLAAVMQDGRRSRSDSSIASSRSDAHYDLVRAMDAPDRRPHRPRDRAVGRRRDHRRVLGEHALAVARLGRRTLRSRSAISSSESSTSRRRASTSKTMIRPLIAPIGPPRTASGARGPP